MKRAIPVVALFYFFIPLVSYAWDLGDFRYDYDSPDETVIGETRSILYTGTKTPSEIGRAFHLGYDEMKVANPGLKPGRSIRGKEVSLPTSWILPEVMNKGILINLAELRLYFFHQTSDRGAVVSTFPIGIGRGGYNTPTGDFKVVSLAENPTWFPSRSSKKLNPNIPSEIPAGPKNPLGKHYIKLSINGYGIHGTNRPSSIGRRVSLGCIRLFPENVAWLFNRVYPGMPVKIINKPVKFGRRDGKLYLAVHGRGRDDGELFGEIRRAAEVFGISSFDDEAIKTLLTQANGVPLLLETPVFSAKKQDKNPAVSDSLLAAAHLSSAPIDAP